MTTVPLGPGTITVTIAPGTAQDFSCEVMSGTVNHTYETIGESKTPICGDAQPATETRADGFTFHVENDLSATGMYTFLMTNDLATAAVLYTPNSAWALAWAGDVTLHLPDSIGADEYGAVISSDVTWPAVGLLEFTPGTAPAAAVA